LQIGITQKLKATNTLDEFIKCWQSDTWALYCTMRNKENEIADRKKAIKEHCKHNSEETACKQQVKQKKLIDLSDKNYFDPSELDDLNLD